MTIARGLLLSLCLWAGTAHAQSDPATLAQAAAHQMAAAHSLLNEAENAGDRVAALTQTIHAYEDGLQALREGLRRAAIREAAIRKEFEQESESVSRLLGVLLSVQSSSGPLSLLHPSGPLGTARSGMIVADITPAIQQQANDLKARLEEVALLRALQETAETSLIEGLQGVQNARTALSQAISNRTELPRKFLSDPDQIQRLINNTETLDGFATGLTYINPGDGITDDPVLDFQQAKGTLALPVSGTVIRPFNQPDAADVRRPGLLIATRPQALVTAPWPATLRYAGPLLDYGNVMIFEPSADILLVLAGLDQVYGDVGQVLPANVAVGMMGGFEPDSDTFLMNTTNGTGSDQTETLYIELRMGGEPVDPTQWFVETKE